MLDLTDNYSDDKVVRPQNIVSYDDPDPYLVVAADKGTAKFSDIANAVSADYQFWLGDAFASGGSRGYDHKALGITARGAWKCVQRHFREASSLQAKIYKTKPLPSSALAAWTAMFLAMACCCHPVSGY